MTKESVYPCLREGKVLMEFEKGGIWVLFRGCRGNSACRDGRDCNAYRAHRGRWIRGCKACNDHKACRGGRANKGG